MDIETRIRDAFQDGDDVVKDDALDAALNEIERLRDTLRSIHATKYGLQSVMEDYGHDANAYNYHAMKYWADLAARYESLAGSALNPRNETV